MAVTLYGNGNSIVQAVSTTSATTTSTTSSTFVPVTGMSLSITPKSASNKILIMFAGQGYGGGSGAQCNYTVYRNGTNLVGAYGLGTTYTGSGGGTEAQAVALYLDSPATTSAVTYQVYIRNSNNGLTVSISIDGCTSALTLMEVSGA